MTTTTVDAFTEFCRITISEKGGTDYDFEGMTEDISAMDWGEKDIEGIATVKGGRIVKRTPMTDESITLKVYPTSAKLGADNEGFIQHFHPQTGDAIQGLVADDDSQPIAVKNSHARKTYRLLILWSSLLPADAATQPAAGEAAYRIQVVNAYMTSFKPSFDDKIISAEATFKWAPFDKDGAYNKVEESTDGSSQLPAVTAFS